MSDEMLRANLLLKVMTMKEYQIDVGESENPILEKLSCLLTTCEVLDFGKVIVMVDTLIITIYKPEEKEQTRLEENCDKIISGLQNG